MFSDPQKAAHTPFDSANPPRFAKFEAPQLPERKKSLMILGALASSLPLVLWGCLSGPEGRSKPVTGNGVTVSLQLLPATLAKGSSSTSASTASSSSSVAASRPVDSASVIVSGNDMDTLRFGFGGSSTTLSMMDIPPGTNRKFDVRLFYAGRLLYAGTAQAELRTDRPNSVSVNCLPEFSRLSASIHIPIDFPKTVSGGSLRLWNETDTLMAASTTSGELRNFRLEEVPGDRIYAVSLALWDPSGDTIATAYKADLQVPKGQNVALVLPLALAYTQLALIMTVGDPKSTTLVLTFPGSKRVPTGFGDLVFSEFSALPATEDGGDAAGEWIEFFNRSTDSLDVSGCQVVRDAGSSASMLAVMPGGTVVAPGRNLVVGRSAVSFANVTISASALSLTNTSARLEFNCSAGAVRVDTLRYTTTASDTLAARIATSKVTTLKPSRLGTRHKSDAWCLSALTPATGEYAATPAALIGGCGE